MRELTPPPLAQETADLKEQAAATSGASEEKLQEFEDAKDAYSDADGMSKNLGRKVKEAQLQVQSLEVSARAKRGRTSEANAEREVFCL